MSAAVDRLGALLLGRASGHPALAIADLPAAQRGLARPDASVARLVDEHRDTLVDWLAALDASARREGWSVAPHRALARALEAWLQKRNQFAAFEPAGRAAVEAVYRRAFDELHGALERDEREGLDGVFARHHARLATLVPSLLASELRDTVCGHYSPDTQLRVLGLDPAPGDGPVLDVGCGATGALVRDLRGRGVAAHGIDRVRGEDWLAFDYGERRWGLVVSHLGFSLHFLRAHHRGGPRAYAYARAYMRILASLRAGGRFAYAPTLPFLEDLLPPPFDVVRLPRATHVVRAGSPSPSDRPIRSPG